MRKQKQWRLRIIAKQSTRRLTNLTESSSRTNRKLHRRLRRKSLKRRGTRKSNSKKLTLRFKLHRRTQTNHPLSALHEVFNLHSNSYRLMSSTRSGANTPAIPRRTWPSY